MLSKQLRIRVSLLSFYSLFLIFIANAQTPETPQPAVTPTPDAAVSATAQPSPALNNPPTTVLSTTHEIKSAPEDLVHYGDVIEVDVVGSVEYDWRGQINPEGFINGLSLGVDPVFALCHSQQSVAEKVVAAYSKYLRNPEIVVRIVDRNARPLTTMLGAIRTPQSYRVKRTVRLNELIALAGGLVDTASGEVQIFRPTKLSCGEDDGVAFSRATEDGSRYLRIKLAELITGRPQANPVVKPGDMITVEEAAEIYVIGGVTYPQKIFARQEMSVSRAIATAGGAVKGADTKSIVIYRRKNGDSARIEVDLTKIEAKQAEDVVLQPFDIIEVPRGGRDPKMAPPVLPPLNVKSTNGNGLPVVVVD